MTTEEVKTPSGETPGNPQGETPGNPESQENSSPSKKALDIQADMLFNPKFSTKLMNELMPQ